MGFTREDWLWTTSLGLLHAAGVVLVNSRVGAPYMDEVFHVTQTRSFCRGDWSYDPKITTPPALYVLAMPLCGHERFFNSFLLPIAFLGFVRFRRRFKNEEARLTSLVALCLPVLLHSSLLFYTDLLSIATVVWAFALSPLPSSVVFLLGLLTRQTNIIWAGVYALLHLSTRFDSRRPFSIIKEILHLFPFLLLLAGFLFFVLKNGGIVLGDAAAHQPVTHFSQLLYFFLFVFLHSWPLVISRLGNFLSFLLQEHRRLLNATLVFSLVVYFFTFDHLYLISDNRHVPFYLWRWWLGKSFFHRFVLSPLYATAAFFVFWGMPSRISSLLFLLASLAVLVPVHLLEPRYFITPYVIWRLSYIPTTKRHFLVLELVSNLLVFSVVFYIFLYKPFEWSNEPGKKQRFMW